MKINREIVALILLPLLYLYIMGLPPVFFLGLLSVVSFIAQMEFYSMYGVGRGFSLFGAASGVTLLYLVYRGGDHIQLFVTAFFAVVVLLRLFDHRRGPSGALSDIAPVLTGFLYIPLVLSLLVTVREAGPEWIVLIMATVWASDSLAYYLGKTFGKRKLYPAVSPGKTVIGALGSLAGGALTGVLVKVLLIEALGIQQALFLGLLIGGVTIAGDLAESMFKRDSGVKDSGSLLPGHGGVLDKIDGMIFVTPVVYVVVRFVA